MITQHVRDDNDNDDDGDDDDNDGGGGNTVIMRICLCSSWYVLTYDLAGHNTVIVSLPDCLPACLTD